MEARDRRGLMHFASKERCSARLPSRADAPCAHRPKLGVLFITAIPTKAAVAGSGARRAAQLIIKPFALAALAARVWSS